MRKKLLRMPRLTQVLPKSIITFDNKEHGQCLLEPVPRKLCGPDTFARHAAVLQASAAEAGTVCLANNQIQQEQRMMAIHRCPLSHPIHSNSILWISLDYNAPEDYEVFSNPEILAGEKLVEQEEESISFPLITFTVRRYSSIAVRFRGREGREERQLSGPAAWAFQQGLQQLDGTIPFDWRVSHGNVRFSQEAVLHFPKSSAVLEEFGKDLKRVFEDYPELVRKEDRFEGRLPINEMHGESLPFENDYYRRLMKHYEREMGLLQERLTGGQKVREWTEPEGVDVRIIDK